MALVVFDRVQETTATTGTGTITLGGAVDGYQSFAVVGNGNTTFYCIVSGSAWEVGIGTYTSSGTTLARTTVLSNSLGTTAPISLTGSSNVFVTYPAGKSVNLDSSGNVGPLGTITSGVWNGTTIPVAYGGTGVTASSGANSVVLRDANQNISINRLNQGLLITTASGGTTVLTVASAFNQALTGTGGHTYQLPDATTLSNTTAFQFNNNATGTLTIVNNASTTVGTIAPGGAAGIALLSNATVGGSWDVHAYIPENVTWGTNALALGSTVITGGTWNGGTVASGYGGTGLTTFSAANNALYSTSASALTAGTLPVLAGGTGSTTDSGARTNLGATTVGSAVFTAVDAAAARSAIGAGTSSTTGTVTSVATGTGLTGGPITGSGTVSLANTSVTAGSYTNTSLTVDAQGRITAASSGAGASGTVTSVSGTGTASGLSLSGTVTTSGSLTLSGTVNSLAAGTYGISISGNAATATSATSASSATTATTLSTGQSNWSGSGVINNVVGMLAWKQYGNSHVIFDASNSTTPSGTSCSSTNSANAWSAAYPTLMGWNGSTTYGVRVDSSRVADSAGSASSATSASYLTGPAATNGSDGWFRSSGVAGNYYATYGRGTQPVDGNVSYGSSCIYGAGLNGWTGWSVNTSNNCILMSNASTHGFYSPANGVWQIQWDSVGNATFNGNITAYSDIRLKDNIREIDNPIDRRDTLANSAIKYERDGKTRIGYGAQYLIEGGCGEFVTEAEDDAYKLTTGLGTLSVDYGETTAILAVASKMTDDKVEILEARIAQLEKIIEGLIK